jgi:hypothetical protein
MNPSRDRSPTPDELVLSPELAVLTLLDYSAELALRFLLTVYPGLDDPERPDWLPEASRSETAAQPILSLLPRLRQALADYHQVARLEYDALFAPDDPCPPGKIPF